MKVLKIVLAICLGFVLKVNARPLATKGSPEVKFSKLILQNDTDNPIQVFVGPGEKSHDSSKYVKLSSWDQKEFPIADQGKGEVVLINKKAFGLRVYKTKPLYLLYLDVLSPITPALNFRVLIDDNGIAGIRIKKLLESM